MRFGKMSKSELVLFLYEYFNKINGEDEDG